MVLISMVIGSKVMIDFVFTIQIREIVISNAFIFFIIIFKSSETRTFVVQRQEKSIFIFAYTHFSIIMRFNRRVILIFPHFYILLIVTVQIKIVKETFISRRSIINIKKHKKLFNYLKNT